MIHLRYTPDDISGYTFDFLDSLSSKFIVARELLDDKKQPLLHYHILLETDYGEKTIRDAAKSALKIPKTGRGKNNKYYALFADWKDPSYICKYDDIIRSKGYSEKTLMDLSIEGKSRYLTEDECLIKDEEGQVKNLNVVTIQNAAKKTQSVDRLVSGDLLAWFYDYTHQHDGEEPDKRKIIDKACELYRKNGKGINIFKVRDTVHTLYYDVNTSKDMVIEQIFKLC